MSQIIMSEELLSKAKTAKSFVELKELAAAEDIEATDEQFAWLWRKLSQTEAAELADNELENVAGGGCKKDTPKPVKPKPTSFQGHPLIEQEWNGPCKYGLFLSRRGASEASGCFGCCHAKYHDMEGVEPKFYCEARTI